MLLIKHLFQNWLSLLENYNNMVIVQTNHVYSWIFAICQNGGNRYNYHHYYGTLGTIDTLSKFFTC